MLKATVINSPIGNRVFLNDVEFPWPLHPDIGVGVWDSEIYPGKKIVVLEVMVDEATYREAPSD